MGGWFNGEIVLGSQTYTATDEDGFAAIVQAADDGSFPAGSLRVPMTIPGPGNTRILGVLLDPVDSKPIVAGYYSSAATDFDASVGIVNPRTTPAEPISSSPSTA